MGSTDGFLWVFGGRTVSGEGEPRSVCYRSVCVWDVRGL
jgi:hypothetical protein